MSISKKEVLAMPDYISITRKEFLEDRQGRTFSDVLEDPEQPFDDILAFFNDAQRQRRMEEAEIHHDRAALSAPGTKFLASYLACKKVFFYMRIKCIFNATHCVIVRITYCNRT